MEIVLNEKLLKERKISKEKQKKILDLHKQLAYIKSRPEEFEVPLKAVMDIEFQLQALWGFPLDEKMHRHHWDIKGCKCPKMDNIERLGTGYSIYNTECEIHNIKGNTK